MDQPTQELHIGNRCSPPSPSIGRARLVLSGRNVPGPRCCIHENEEASPFPEAAVDASAPGGLQPYLSVGIQPRPSCPSATSPRVALRPGWRGRRGSTTALAPGARDPPRSRKRDWTLDTQLPRWPRGAGAPAERIGYAPRKEVSAPATVRPAVPRRVKGSVSASAEARPYSEPRALRQRSCPGRGARGPRTTRDHAPLQPALGSRSAGCDGRGRDRAMIEAA